MVLGLRGIPDVQGGVETHAQHLYPRLARLGCDVEVLVRTQYVSPGQSHFGAVRLRRVWCPRSARLEALIHSVIGVAVAGLLRPDILHIHAVGPAIVTPIARLMGLRVVVTHHGPDYDRDKWGPFARWVLRTGERFGMRYSNARIAISKVIADLIMRKYDRDAALIPNGVLPVVATGDHEYVDRFGLEPGKYFLNVGRLVPEKRQLDLIKAYQIVPATSWKLALVGGLSSDAYSSEVRAVANVPGVVLTGFLSGTALRQIYANAGAFVLPSSHEGLPIAMLEALSYGLPVLASDIPPNLEVGLNSECYFPLGNLAALANGLSRLSHEERNDRARVDLRDWVARRYNWDEIADGTLRVYEYVCQ